MAQQELHLTSGSITPQLLRLCLPLLAANVLQQLYNIINSRLIEGKPTIISSNLTAKEIESRYSPRILSRIMGGYYTIPFRGNDIRLLKR